jgi:hypothetical protein
LATYVEHLGGTPIEHRNFRFEIPLSEARKVIPEINRLGLSAKKISERQDTDFQGRTCSIAIIELRRSPKPTEYDDQRNLMRIVCR